jgi:hypothetical protein
MSVPMFMMKFSLFTVFDSQIPHIFIKSPVFIRFDRQILRIHPICSWLDDDVSICSIVKSCEIPLVES